MPLSPGIKTREQIEATVKAVAPKPINFLNHGAFGYTVNDLAALGVRRISVGGTMARVAMHAFVHSARQIMQDGKFDTFAGVVTNAELNKFFPTMTCSAVRSREQPATPSSDRAAHRAPRFMTGRPHVPAR